MSPPGYFFGNGLVHGGLQHGGEWWGGVGGRISCTGATGNSLHHINLPPYYVATLCRKKAENTISDLIIKVSALNFAADERKRGSKVPRPAGPQCAVGTTAVPGNARKDGASGQNGRPIENSDTFAIAGLVVGVTTREGDLWW